MSVKLHGIIPALVTPLDSSGNLDEGVFGRLLEHVYQAGVHGVYLCGSTGEGMVLPTDVRTRIVDLAMRDSPKDKQVIVHVGAWSYQESMKLALHAEKAGATAISSLPPTAASFSEMLENYRTLASATTLPMLAYYFPASTGMTLSAGQLREICALPGVVGLKYTDYDLFTMSMLARARNTLFNGRDEVLCGGLLLGANGGIGSIYNLVPSWFVQIYADGQAGNWTSARATQDQVNDLIAVLIQFPFLSALKRVLTWLGLPCGEPLKPRLQLTSEEATRLHKAVERMLALERLK